LRVGQASRHEGFFGFVALITCEPGLWDGKEARPSEDGAAGTDVPGRPGLFTIPYQKLTYF